MESKQNKGKILSDRALEMVMRDVLSGLRDFSLELETETVSGSAADESEAYALTSNNLTHRQR